MRPIVFLHIPKTAGQTIHFALAELVGARNVSPVRVNELAVDGRKMPPGYLLHSGHIDWVELDDLADDPFVFTVLRDPAERIGSFYFYMLETARTASPDEVKRRIGLNAILNRPVDDYFFGDDETWQWFARNLYFNFYCTYFATRKMAGRPLLKGLSRDAILARALNGAEAIERIYSVERLNLLEDDIERLYGKRIRVAGKYVNTGTHQQDEARWPKLLALFERDSSVRQMESFVEQDRVLMQRLTENGRLV